MNNIEKNKSQLFEVESTLKKQQVYLGLQENMQTQCFNQRFQQQQQKLFRIAESIFNDNQTMFVQNRQVQVENIKIKKQNIGIQTGMNRISQELNLFLDSQHNNYL